MLKNIERDVAGTYAEETKKLFMRLMEGVLESLGISERDDEEGKKMMKEMEEDGSQIMVVNYYPPCPEPELTLGLSPHSDCGFLTLLFQHHHIQALQIQHKSQWLTTVQPLPNSFIVNVGDHLEVLPFLSFHSSISLSIYGKSIMQLVVMQKVT